MQAQFRDQTVLIGVDDMDLFKGIELKLQAVERVLEQHADWRGKLVLVQVTNAPRCGFRGSATDKIDPRSVSSTYGTMLQRAWALLDDLCNR